MLSCTGIVAAPNNYKRSLHLFRVYIFISVDRSNFAAKSDGKTFLVVLLDFHLVLIREYAGEFSV